MIERGYISPKILLYAGLVAGLAAIVVCSSSGLLAGVIAIMGWAYLLIAIAAEVFSTSALKAADGFTRLWPTIGVIFGYGLSLYFLSLALRSIPVGIAYALWSGIGIVCIACIGYFAYGQRLDAAARGRGRPLRPGVFAQQTENRPVRKDRAVSFPAGAGGGITSG